MVTSKTLDEQLDRLAAFPPSPFPVISLYLNTQPGPTGKAKHDPFVRKELARTAASYPRGSVESESFDKDAERIRTWLDTELEPSTNGVAIFACFGQEEFFEAIQMDAPVRQNRLHVYHQPHLYQLAVIYDQFPRYAAVIADKNHARILVFGARSLENIQTVDSEKTRRTSMGGWSQARYQRRDDNAALQHVRELVHTLEKLVREEGIQKIFFAGDEVILPVIQQEMTPEIANRFAENLKLDIRTPEHEILTATMIAMRELDAREDQDKVQRMIGEWRSGNLGVTGVRDVLQALSNGQVDELFISGDFDRRHANPELVEARFVPELIESGEASNGGLKEVLLADQLVTMARQTGASITIIEDPALLENVGGVGATLRYRI